MKDLGRPPMASSWRAVVTALAAMAVALAGLGGPFVTGVVVALLGVLFALGWPVLVSTPDPRGSSVVIGAASLASGVVAITTHSPAYLSLVVAFGVIGAFMQQMLRGDNRDNLVSSLSATVTGVVVVASASGWALALMTYGGEEVVIAALAVLVLASAVTSLPFRSMLIAGTAALLGTAAGLGIGAVLPHLSLVTGAIAGLVGGGMMALSHVVLGTFPAANRWSAAAAAALLPMLVLGIPIHLLAAVAA